MEKGIQQIDTEAYFTSVPVSAVKTCILLQASVNGTLLASSFQVIQNKATFELSKSNEKNLDDMSLSFIFFIIHIILKKKHFLFP